MFLMDYSDPSTLTLLMATGNDLQWKQQVSTTLAYLMHSVNELKMENDDLRRKLTEFTQIEAINFNQDVDDKLLFNAVYVDDRPIQGFDPLNPERTLTLGTIVADFANGHGLNGSTLGQVVQPITTGVIRKLFEIEADKYTYTEDSVGKGRPVRYAKIPTEFIKELSEAICDGFNPSKTQRARILPQARTMAGTVARNYFNNARSHRKKNYSDSTGTALSNEEESMDVNEKTN